MSLVSCLNDKDYFGTRASHGDATVGNLDRAFDNILEEVKENDENIAEAAKNKTYYYLEIQKLLWKQSAQVHSSPVAAVTGSGSSTIPALSSSKMLEIASKIGELLRGYFAQIGIKFDLEQKKQRLSDEEDRLRMAKNAEKVQQEFNHNATKAADQRQKQALERLA